MRLVQPTSWVSPLTVHWQSTIWPSGSKLALPSKSTNSPGSLSLSAILRLPPAITAVGGAFAPATTVTVTVAGVDAAELVVDRVVEAVGAGEARHSACTRCRPSMTLTVPFAAVRDVRDLQDVTVGVVVVRQHRDRDRETGGRCSPCRRSRPGCGSPPMTVTVAVSSCRETVWAWYWKVSVPRNPDGGVYWTCTWLALMATVPPWLGCVDSAAIVVTLASLSSTLIVIGWSLNVVAASSTAIGRRGQSIDDLHRDRREVAGAAERIEHPVGERVGAGRSRNSACTRAAGSYRRSRAPLSRSPAASRLEVVIGEGVVGIVVVVEHRGSPRGSVLARLCIVDWRRGARPRSR